MTDLSIAAEAAKTAVARRILFIGGTPRGRRVFDLLLRRGIVPVATYVLAEDDHETLRASVEIEAIAGNHAIPVKICKRITADDLAVIRDTYLPDLILVVGWRTILPAALYELPLFGCVGVHDSPLPRYRGFAPPNWAIINGEQEWGVTLMHIAAGVDEGDIIGQKVFPVPDRATAPELHELIISATVVLIDEQLDGLLTGVAPRIAQDHTRATYACARNPDDGEIDWRQGTTEIDRLIRGLTYPYPGAWTTWRGQKLKVWDAEPVDPPPLYEGRIPGRVVAFNDETTDVLTGDGVLRLRAVELQGGGRKPAGAVLRSVKSSLGKLV